MPNISRGSMAWRRVQNALGQTRENFTRIWNWRRIFRLVSYIYNCGWNSLQPIKRVTCAFRRKCQRYTPLHWSTVCPRASLASYGRWVSMDGIRIGYPAGYLRFCLKQDWVLLIIFQENLIKISVWFLSRNFPESHSRCHKSNVMFSVATASFFSLERSGVFLFYLGFWGFY